MKRRYSEFKDNIDIDSLEQAIGFTPLYQQGGNDIGHCVFPHNHAHGDTTGKFAIHREKLVYNCFACGGGSLLSLVMELRDLDVDAATEWLYQFATGIDHRSDQEFNDYLMGMLEDVQKRVNTMPYFNQRVLERFDGPSDYFLTRGISPEVIESANLCFGEHVMKPAPLKQKGAQIIKIDEDYYGPAAIFPHYWQGRLVGWQHRWIEWDEEHDETPKWLAKYTNTTDFPKDNTVFNYDAALKAKEPVVICESVATVLFLISNGVPAVSYFGSDINDAQLRLIRRFTNGVMLAPDNDKTGDRLVNKAVAYLERFIPVWVIPQVRLGPKADLGDFAKADHPAMRLHEHLLRAERVGVKI